MENLKKKESKGCLGGALIFFCLTAFYPLLTLIFGGDPRGMKTVDKNTGELNDIMFNLRLSFIVLIIALFYYIWAHYINNEKDEV